jgi:hypothetical protein
MIQYFLLRKTPSRSFTLRMVVAPVLRGDGKAIGHYFDDSLSDGLEETRDVHPTLIILIWE